MTDPLVRDLEQKSCADLLALFQTLKAPQLSELHGEYRARLLTQVNPLMQRVGLGTLNNPILGRWQCKAFRPVDAESGRGYNGFSRGGRFVQRYPMATLVAPSRYDGQQAYMLVYRAFHSACGSIHMVDEIRRLDDTHYLGIGTCGFTERQRRRPLPFMLSGPVGEYRGDIGRERAHFAPQQEIPALAGMS